MLSSEHPEKIGDRTDTVISQANDSSVLKSSLEDMNR